MATRRDAPFGDGVDYRHVDLGHLDELRCARESQTGMALLLFGMRAVLTVVLGAAVLGKLRSRRGFHEFVQALRDSDLIPGQAVRPAALTLLALEASGFVLLISPSHARAGLVVSLLVMLVLTCGVTAIVTMRRSVRCNCFGADGSILSRRHIVRNLTLSLLALCALGADRIVTGPSGEGEFTFLAVSAGALIGVCAVAWDDIAFVLLGSPGLTVDR